MLNGCAVELPLAPPGFGPGFVPQDTPCPPLPHPLPLPLAGEGDPSPPPSRRACLARLDAQLDACHAHADACVRAWATGRGLGGVRAFLPGEGHCERRRGAKKNFWGLLCLGNLKFPANANRKEHTWSL